VYGGYEHPPISLSQSSGQYVHLDGLEVLVLIDAIEVSQQRQANEDITGSLW
jgi:hypothetical protein